MHWLKKIVQTINNCREKPGEHRDSGKAERTMRLNLQPIRQLMRATKTAGSKSSYGIRMLAACLMLMSSAVTTSVVMSVTTATSVEAAVVNRITVRGNQRVDADTIIFNT